MGTGSNVARARWQLWAVTFAIMTALAAGIIVLSATDPGDWAPVFLPSRLLLAAGLAGIILAFVLYAIDRERHLHRLSERLVRERFESEQLTERLRHLSELTRERDTNAALLEASADAIAVVDGDGTILRFNRTMELLTGISHADALGRPATEVLRFGGEHPGLLTELENPVRAVLADGLPRAGRELRLRRLDGEETWVSATLSPVPDPDSDDTAVVLVTLHDIAQQKEQERMQRDFVSMAAHELRSPLTAIKGFARTLALKADALSPERRSTYLAMIDDQSNRLARLVDDLMQVARIDAGRVVIEPEQIDVGVIARELLEQFGGKWNQHAITVRVRGGLPVTIADPHRIEEVLINLIDNAVKYSPDGAPVEVMIDAGGEELIVAVADRGIGIPPDELPRLFQKFTRIASDASADIPGTGLGLYIVKGLVEAHGGRVWAESEPGRGSTVTFTLPLSMSAAATGTEGR